MSSLKVNRSLNSSVEKCDCVWMVCPTVSNPLFMTCLWKIFSSIVPVVMSLYTWQCCFCPSLHTLAMACRSVAGFQSMSYKTSLLAPIRFSPVPPALELSRKTLMSEWTQLIQTLEGLFQELLSEDLQTKPPKTFGLSKLCALSFGIADRV